ncbi:MAG: hypothetical protein ACXADA_06630 [Candidatus Hodarchaeales archaeon]|jgi:hypothetical protein
MNKFEKKLNKRLTETQFLINLRKDITKEVENRKDHISLHEKSVLDDDYRAKGDINAAVKYAKQALVLSEKVGNNTVTARVLYSLVAFSLEQHQFKEAKVYSQQLENLWIQMNQLNSKKKGFIRSQKTISQYARLSKAIILKTSPRMRDKGKAQDIYQQVTEEEIIDFEITYDAMLNLCELLLFESKTLGEKVVLQEAKILVQQLDEQARQQQSFSSVVEILLLQAKLSLVEGDLTTSVEFLKKQK